MQKLVLTGKVRLSNDHSELHERMSISLEDTKTARVEGIAISMSACGTD